jgi:hypothetical protein
LDKESLPRFSPFWYKDSHHVSHVIQMASAISELSDTFFRSSGTCLTGVRGTRFLVCRKINATCNFTLYLMLQRFFLAPHVCQEAFCSRPCCFMHMSALWRLWTFLVTGFVRVYQDSVSWTLLRRIPCGRGWRACASLQSGPRKIDHREDALSGSLFKRFQYPSSKPPVRKIPKRCHRIYFLGRLRYSFSKCWLQFCWWMLFEVSFFYSTCRTILSTGADRINLNNIRSDMTQLSLVHWIVAVFIKEGWSLCGCPIPLILDRPLCPASLLDQIPAL